jgi:hypothetical protein
LVQDPANIILEFRRLLGHHRLIKKRASFGTCAQDPSAAPADILVEGEVAVGDGQRIVIDDPDAAPRWKVAEEHQPHENGKRCDPKPRLSLPAANCQHEAEAHIVHRGRLSDNVYRP